MKIDKWMPKSRTIYRNGRYEGVITFNGNIIQSITEEELDDFVYKHFPSLKHHKIIK